MPISFELSVEIISWIISALAAYALVGIIMPAMILMSSRLWRKIIVELFINKEPK